MTASLPRLIQVAAIAALLAGRLSAQVPRTTAPAAPSLEGIPPELRAKAAQLIAAATHSTVGYARLQTLCDTFGPRHTGSTNQAAAIAWALDQLRNEGFTNVHAEPVTVPRWVRGRESATLLAPREVPLPMLGLGGSVGTPPEGITAPVLVVTNFEQLAARTNEAQGRIIVFNIPYVSYGQTVGIRSRGAAEAARVGGLASLIRSVTPSSLRTPHTGLMTYPAQGPRVPTAALATEDAEMLWRMQERGQTPVIRLCMEAQTTGETVTYNVIADMAGRSRPEEIVLISGHFDSWDVGQGALDDGAGCLVAWEAARLIHELGWRPRRTIRVVLWTNEEYGSHGAKEYARLHREELSRYVLAMESDSGIFQPLGFRFTGSEKAAALMGGILSLMEPVGASRLTLGGADADIQPLLAAGVPTASLATENSRYFYYHHSEADTVDKVDRVEFQRCTAATAVLAYLLADLPEPLPR